MSTNQYAAYPYGQLARAIARRWSLGIMNRGLARFRPVFLRVCASIEATSTFKQIKGNLIRQGYDPSIIKDCIYVKDREQQGFVQLDQALYDAIQNGTVKF
jgi:fatty-acyl-CoA synthase